MHKIIKCEADDLRFVMFNHALHHRQWVKKSFAGYFSINYAHTGFVRHRVGDGLERVLHAPVAWWTWPGPEFQYGNLVAPGWDHYYVCYAGDLLKKWKREGWMPPPEASTAWRHPQDPEAFRDKMLALHQHIATGKSRRAMLGLLDLLLDVKEGDVSRDSLGERVRAIAASLRERPAEGCDEDLHADSLAVSAVHFRRLFLRDRFAPTPFHHGCPPTAGCRTPARLGFSSQADCRRMWILRRIPSLPPLPPEVRPTPWRLPKPSPPIGSEFQQA